MRIVIFFTIIVLTSSCPCIDRETLGHSTWYLLHEIAKQPPSPYFDTFMNDGPESTTIKDLIVGISFGTALGFVDTLGIWIGVEEISKYIKGTAKIKAAIGNLYSNLLGISVGTAVSVIMDSLLRPSNSQKPIYLTAAGSIIGAVIGIYVGNTFF